MVNISLFYFSETAYYFLLFSVGASATVLVKMGCCFMFGKKAEQAAQGDDGQQSLHYCYCYIHLTFMRFSILTCSCFVVPDVHSVKVFSYNELRKATQDFSGGNKIGEGGFGSVFRVNMHNIFQHLIVFLGRQHENPWLIFQFWLIRECLKMGQ